MIIKRTSMKTSYLKFESFQVQDLVESLASRFPSAMVHSIPLFIELLKNIVCPSNSLRRASEHSSPVEAGSQFGGLLQEATVTLGRLSPCKKMGCHMSDRILLYTQLSGAFRREKALLSATQHPSGVCISCSRASPWAE